MISLFTRTTVPLDLFISADDLSARMLIIVKPFLRCLPDHLYWHTQLPPHVVTMFLPAMPSSPEMHLVGWTGFKPGTHDVVRAREAMSDPSSVETIHPRLDGASADVLCFNPTNYFTHPPPCWLRLLLNSWRRSFVRSKVASFWARKPLDCDL